MSSTPPAGNPDWLTDVAFVLDERRQILPGSRIPGLDPPVALIGVNREWQRQPRATEPRVATVDDSGLVTAHVRLAGSTCVR